MKSPAEIIEALKRGPTDVVGLDLGRRAVHAVRMRKNGEELAVVAVDIIELPAPADAPEAEQADATAPSLLAFSSDLHAHYASVALDSGPATIRLLTLPGKERTDIDDQVIDNLGIENVDEYRISYTLLDDGSARTETRVVAVAYPEHLTAASLAMLPTTGTPAPHSIEVSGLASMTAFLNGPVSQRPKETLGLIDFGETSSLFAFFQRGTPVLIRKLERGTNALLERVEATLGVTHDTALGIISDGSFDISAVATEMLQPLIHQLVVSRDFVERRDNCKVNAVYLSGGLAASRDTQNEVGNAMGVTVESWNPFGDIAMAPNAIPEHLQGQEWRFAAAVGACMGTLEQ